MMAVWEWFRHVINRAEVLQLILFLLRFLVAAESPVELEFDEIRVGLDRRTLIYLDVRRREELLEHGKVAATHSVNIPLPELEEAFFQDDEHFLSAYGFTKPAQNATNVVIGCRSGRRAVTANEKLQSLGYSSFKIYKGSFLDWVEKGGPIVKE